MIYVILCLCLSILTVAFVAVNAKLVTGMAIGKAFAGVPAMGCCTL